MTTPQQPQNPATQNPTPPPGTVPPTQPPTEPRPEEESEKEGKKYDGGEIPRTETPDDKPDQPNQ